MTSAVQARVADEMSREGRVSLDTFLFDFASQRFHLVCNVRITVLLPTVNIQQGFR